MSRKPQKRVIIACSACREQRVRATIASGLCWACYQNPHRQAVKEAERDLELYWAGDGGLVGSGGELISMEGAEKRLLTA